MSITPEPIDLSARLKVHRSARSVLRAHWQPVFVANGIPAREWIAGEMHLTDESGRKVRPRSMADVLAGIESMGLWGWCDTKTRTVHVWVGPDAPRTTVLHLLSHELAHVAERLRKPRTKDPVLLEEWRCEATAAVCLTAVKWAERFQGVG